MAKKRPVAVFHLRKLQNKGDFIIKVRTIALDMNNNTAYFAGAAALLTTVSNDTDALESAQTLSQTRVPGSVAARDIIYYKTLQDVYGLQVFVQTLADAAVYDEAIAIISASGFSLRLSKVNVKADLDARNGKASGTIKLIAKAAANRAAYDWQMSEDGKTWTSQPPTLQAKTTVTGLTRSAILYFRFRAVLKNETSAWSQVVSIVVL